MTLPSRLNRHGNLPYYSELNSLLDNGVSCGSIYCNPPWSLVIACVQHLRACHARAPMNTKAIIVLPNWLVYKAIAKELKLLKQIHIREIIFMRPTTIGSYNSLDVINSIWVIKFWVIGPDTHIMEATPAILAAPKMTPAQNIDDLPTDTSTNGMESETTIEAADKYVSIASALVVMDPLENQSLMRLSDMVSRETLTSKADTLIDTAASLNF